MVIFRNKYEKNLERLKPHVLGCKYNGSYKLSSGKYSDTYYDLKKIMLNGSTLSLIGDLFLYYVYKFKPVAVGGLSMGADFIVASVIQKDRIYGAHGSIVRKQVKEHGTENVIENMAIPYTTIMVVDDVLTTGKSIEIACDAFLKQKYIIVGIVTILDRMEGGYIKLRNKYHVPIYSLYNIHSLQR